MDAAGERARRTGPRELSVALTPRYRVLWGFNRLVMRLLFDVRATGLEHLPAPPFQLVANHHNGFDPMLVMSITPVDPRITWFGPREADFSRGFKNRVMAYFGGMIPYNPEKTTLTSAVRAVRRVFEADGVLGIFAEGRIGFRESELLPFEEGAAAFAAMSAVPVVPCAIVGSTDLWFRRRVDVRFGPAIATDDARGREARAGLESRIREAIQALLPETEPRLPRRRPLQFLTNLLNGPEDVARRTSAGQ
jgi:1-acyl-sn-glycerol-3-phosphate acyltransferase